MGLQIYIFLNQYLSIFSFMINLEVRLWISSSLVLLQNCLGSSKFFSIDKKFSNFGKIGINMCYARQKDVYVLPRRIGNHWFCNFSRTMHALADKTAFSTRFPHSLFGDSRKFNLCLVLRILKYFPGFSSPFSEGSNETESCTEYDIHLWESSFYEETYSYKIKSYFFFVRSSLL